MSPPAPPCAHRGGPTGRALDSAACGGAKAIPLVACSLHGECTVERRLIARQGGFTVRYAWCRICRDRRAPGAVGG